MAGQSSSSASVRPLAGVPENAIHEVLVGLVVVPRRHDRFLPVRIWSGGRCRRCGEGGWFQQAVECVRVRLRHRGCLVELLAGSAEHVLADDPGTGVSLDVPAPLVPVVTTAVILSMWQSTGNLRVHLKRFSSSTVYFMKYTSVGANRP